MTDYPPHYPPQIYDAAAELGVEQINEDVWRVRTGTDPDWPIYVDVFKQRAWKVVETPIAAAAIFNRSWIYDGGTDGFRRAVLAAQAWDGRADSEPEGWLLAYDGRTPGQTRTPEEHRAAAMRTTLAVAERLAGLNDAFPGLAEALLRAART